jgi:acyl-coenzyme A thioesterase 13
MRCAISNHTPFDFCLFVSTMSSRLALSSASAFAMSPVLPTHDIIPNTSSEEKAWVNPASLPTHPHPTFIGGNAPEYVKQLNYNTFMAYGVGEEDSFGFRVGRAVRFTEVNVNRKMERQGRLEATTTAEIEVVKRKLSRAEFSPLFRLFSQPTS